MGRWVDNNAFTLMEVLVSIAIMGLVFSAGYGIYSVVLNSYDRAERNWQLQNDLSKAANYIINELRHAYYLEFAPLDMEKDEEDDNYLFIDGSGAIIHRKAGQDKVVVNPVNGEMKYFLNFEQAQNADGEYIRDTIEFEISITNTDFNFSSAIMLANMAKQDSFAGEFPAGEIYYRRAPQTGSIPAAELSTFCFIATASYGSPLTGPVKLLRLFRDLVLLKTKPGKFIVSLYYSYSPPLARMIDKNIFLKQLCRILLIPFILFAFILVNISIFIKLFLSTIFASCLCRIWLKKIYFKGMRGDNHVLRWQKVYNCRYR